MYTIFLAGIIQGSQSGKGVHSQDYRRRLKGILERAVPDVAVYCPVENHPNSVDYDVDQARTVFLGHVDRAANSDVVVAFLPQASMGTAIELWQAYQAGRIIFTISPLAENWVVKILAKRNFASVDEFEAFVESGQLQDVLSRHEQ